MSTTTPPWPSLYSPGLEVLHIQHNSPVQPGAFYLYNANVCGSYAFFNYAFPPSPKRGTANRLDRDTYQMANITQPGAFGRLAGRPPKIPKPNERRSRVTFALIVLVTFLVLSVIGAVIASAILGYIMAGVYKAASFNMST
ncbi:hypothetical protein CVT24_002895 [Panaeolus cyanescens]|uniref:Uncharacterized protein n=1 Tax=Panaeolus cyanescens TaxID=181874 RepID=A0A409YXQ2_9AGAR|nr:hypothetical protein CVT24_002895 [Panaeolus cyanescens]